MRAYSEDKWKQATQLYNGNSLECYESSSEAVIMFKLIFKNNNFLGLWMIRNSL